MASVAVIGLGNMGLAIARRLAQRGHRVTGVDPVEERRTVWRVLSGGTAAVASVGDVAWGDVERAVVIVRTSEQLRTALPELTQAVEAAGVRPTALAAHVMTTITPADARALPGYGTGSMVRLVENPITGAEAGALAGTLTAMVAGATDEDVAFLRGSLAEEVVCFEALGQPSLAKLLNNLACAYNLAAFGAVVKLGAEQGLDPARLQQVIARGSGTSFAARAVVEMLGDLLAKDVALAADSVGGSLPVVSVADVEGGLAELRRLLGSGGGSPRG